ncbi:protein O-mannosyl-transferase family [Epilithonimonas xixisoli]|uniref:Uncharacterized protein DUF2723 n=1 Tax=Epilithonimonas xixisoli TaxID=1476462 RepID=A0A4R8ICW8_9FLAO|nr:glycosyltransferase family 39 protein [Epilithonimonas xixisoli]TDX82585.1 uncharacterized protein DUF2723 [Epilithonimonas xixisoli]
MSKKTITFLISAVFFLIYYAGSFSKISFGDCIGFVVDAEKREFITNFTPLVHFLYINTGIFFTSVLNMDSIFVMRMLSIVPAALTVGLVYVLIKEFLEENWIAIASTIVFGFSFSFWRSAETVEVYTLNAFWVVLFLLFAVKALKHQSKKYIVTAGIVLGLSLWVHIQNIMLIPAYFLLLYYSKSERQKVLTSFIFFISIFGVMFVVNQLNGIEFKYVFTSKKGPWVQNTFDQTFLDLVKNVVKAIAFLIYNFNIFIVFCFSGIFYLYKNFKKEFLFLFVAALFTLGFATIYAVSDNYVYFIPFYLIFTIFIASGIKKLSEKLALKKFQLLPIMIPLFYVFSFYIALIIPQGKEFHTKKLYKGGLNYYMLPWLTDNIGCLEFTLNDGKTEDNVEALKETSQEFIKLRKRYQSLEEIREL